MNVCSSLNKLKKLYPIKGCVHIGVGGPHSLQLYEQLDVENVVFIDANQQRLNSLSPKFAQRPGWVRLCKVIGAQVSERTYYETNSANENGLISAEDLRPLWKNLQVRRQSARDVIDLTSCLIEHQEEINLDNPNFLNIDCFPALDVLTGADELLGKMDLVVTRVVTDEDLASKINGVSAKKIDVFLREKGFIKFATEVERHPAVSKVVYARGLKELKKEKCHVGFQVMERDKLHIQSELETLKGKLNLYDDKEFLENLNKDELLKKISSLVESNNRILKHLRGEVVLRNNSEVKQRSEASKKILKKEVGNQTYFVVDGYNHRASYHHFDDQALKDEWQLEVYLLALGLMKKFDFNSVADIGCGSGYKLIKYLGEYETLGLELESNISFLNKQYPKFDWQICDFESDAIKSDVIICSDVIEHLVFPEKLLEFLERCDFKYLVISTPDRNLIYPHCSKGWFGPPKNAAHVREWNYSEFFYLVSSYFDLVDHKICNLSQGTQVIVASKGQELSTESYP